MKTLEKVQRKTRSEDGIIGYGIAWLLGVPATVLVIIYLLFNR